MILYCDTSALLKLYLQEEFSDNTIALAASAKAVAVCRIAWAETMSGLARRLRENPADEQVIEDCRTRFRQDWMQLLIVEVNQDLLERAGDYADTFALRAYDSVQLAAARQLQQEVSETVYFACFDKRLRQAANILGMKTQDSD